MTEKRAEIATDRLIGIRKGVNLFLAQTEEKLCQVLGISLAEYREKIKEYSSYEMEAREHATPNPYHDNFNALWQEKTGNGRIEFFNKGVRFQSRTPEFMIEYLDGYFNEATIGEPTDGILKIFDQQPKPDEIIGRIRIESKKNGQKTTVYLSDKDMFIETGVDQERAEYQFDGHSFSRVNLDRPSVSLPLTIDGKLFDNVVNVSDFLLNKQ